MKKPLLCLLLLIFSALAAWNFLVHPFYGGTPFAALPEKSGRLLLVPLDGRPPCRQFVLDAADIKGIEVSAMPYEFQDYYTAPGDTKALQAWLKENIGTADTVILSIDQLLYGGLLAAREARQSPAEIEEFIAFLRELHEQNPRARLCAFSILPRMTPPASIDGYYDNKYLLEYSRLADRYALEGRPEDAEKMQELAQKIKPASLAQYLALFEQNEHLSRALITLVEEGVLTRLLLGQDDGETYSIPNIEKRRLQELLTQKQLPQEKAAIVHGADELALTLLAALPAETASPRPRIYVDWNDAAAPDMVLPFMAISLQETAWEKIALFGGEPADTPENADFVLFIAAGSEKTVGSRSESAERLAHYLTAGVPVALVDLSKHFAAEETLLPLLIEREVPVEQLIAYAGWNTASNSIGTALSEAMLFSAAKREVKTKEETLRLYAANLKFLNNRFLEDYFYLKDAITLVNTGLKKYGTKNVYDLDLERDYLAATAMLQKAMGDRLKTFKSTKACRRPFPIDTPEGPCRIFVYDIRADMSFPWPRTFEIHLETTPFLSVR
ncbi:DUF4127 family protein [Selenomonas sputigena]|uniref:DUF4127 family protein n=1 Tax=Selenomonas sputigena TaxID=69823 RepID=A0ABV3X743_9FIRM